MIGLNVEHKALWYEPEYNVHKIGDFSPYKQQLICKRFEVESIDELTVGTYVENDNFRVTVVEIDD